MQRTAKALGVTNPILAMFLAVRATRIAIVFVGLVVFAPLSQAAEVKLGFSVRLEGEGFFLNPVVKKLFVEEVTKGSLAEAAGVRAGDEIIKIEGQVVAGKRALALQGFMKLNPGETRTLRLKHADGTEVEARITKPKQ
jgi:C-terminal processing protease CtpA/Prc